MIVRQGLGVPKKYSIHYMAFNQLVNQSIGNLTLMETLVKIEKGTKSVMMMSLSGMLHIVKFDLWRNKIVVACNSLTG